MLSQLIAHYINSANAANAQGEYTIAVGWCQQTLQLAPDLPEAWYNLGVALSGLEKRAEAMDAFEKARIRTLNSADAQNSIGLQLVELCAYIKAEQCLHRSIELSPEYAFAHSNLGKLRWKQKRLEDAEASFRMAIRLQPSLAQAHTNLGAILSDLKKYVAAEAACRKAIDLDSKSPEAWINFGAALSGLKRFIAAEAAYREAIELNANLPVAWAGLGDALNNLKRHEDAVLCFAKGLELNPDEDYLLGLLLHTRMKICDWQSFSNDQSHLCSKLDRGKKAASPFELLSLTTDLALQRKAAEIWVKHTCPVQTNLGPILKPARSNKIAIGYFSADFREHPVSYLMAELLELHDRSRFELIGISFGQETNDAIRKRVAAAFDQFIDVREKSDEEVAVLSREMGIHIAINLGGFTEDSRPNIFAMRAAPIQVNYLGFPGTMGAQYMDYLLTDKTVCLPDSLSYYSEKLAYLPNCFMPHDSTQEISSKPMTRQEFSLPEASFVFCSFNNHYKINPGVFDVWMRLLNKVEGSVLWLSDGSQIVKDNLAREAATRGINPARIVFARRLESMAEHLARYRLADLFIDTLPYNAHTTACDALWAGLPMLTCTGESFASRVAASLLTAIGLPELITGTHAEYEALAIELATNPDRLTQIKQKLERNRRTTALFDTKRLAKDIEQGYTAMYERYLAGLPPEHIEVSQKIGQLL
jgi:predicted O-linked N-acetylglucosamine transferase (SPINDLY family)